MIIPIPDIIIEKAIEGGFGEGVADPSVRNATNVLQYLRSNTAEYYRVLLIDDFWQSLGKVLGWVDKPYMNETLWKGEWHEKAHEFYDLLLSGTSQDTEDYWNKLLAV